MNIRIVFVGVAVWIFATAPLCAEVMDKEPTVVANWMWALLTGGLAIVAWRWRLWLGACISVLALAGIYSMHQEIIDPSVGPAIRVEAGQGNITQFYWSAAVGALPTCDSRVHRLENAACSKPRRRLTSGCTRRRRASICQIQSAPIACQRVQSRPAGFANAVEYASARSSMVLVAECDSARPERTRGAAGEPEPLDG